MQRFQGGFSEDCWKQAMKITNALSSAGNFSYGTFACGIARKNEEVRNTAHLNVTEAVVPLLLHGFEFGDQLEEAGLSVTQEFV